MVFDALNVSLVASDAISGALRNVGMAAGEAGDEAVQAGAEFGSFSSALDAVDDEAMSVAVGNRTLAESIEDVGEDELIEIYGDVTDSVVSVKELTFGQLQRVSDDMMEESFEVDVEREDIEGTPRQGFYQTELLQEAIEAWPSGAPTMPGDYNETLASPGDYPIPVGEWLFEKVDALNTTGDTEMGNSSLEDALSSRR